MKSTLLLVTGIALFGLTGCASIIKGSKQTVTIDSNVKDAEIYLDGALVGKTPYTGELKRGSGKTMMLKKAGYQTKTMTLSTSVEPIFFGNIISGGALGSTTDLATGSMYQYSPASWSIDMIPEGK
jgi:hypothetical protein